MPNSHPPGLHFTILRDSDCWPRKLRNVVTKPVAIPSWKCALHNSSSQLAILDCELHNYNSQSASSDNLDFLLHSSGSQLSSLLEEIAQSLPINPQVCCMSFLKFAFIFVDRLLAMHVTLSLDLVGVFHLFAVPDQWHLREQDQNTLIQVWLE